MSNETLHVKGLVSMIQKIIGMTQKVQVRMHKGRLDCRRYYNIKQQSSQ